MRSSKTRKTWIPTATRNQWPIKTKLTKACKKRRKVMKRRDRRGPQRKAKWETHKELYDSTLFIKLFADVDMKHR